MEKSNSNQWTYSKRGNLVPKKTVEKQDLAMAVRKKPEAVWAYEIEEKIKNRSLACWAASVIWWSFGRKARNNGKLFELMDAYRPNQLRSMDLNYALQLLNLPTI